MKVLKFILTFLVAGLFLLAALLVRPLAVRSPLVLRFSWVCIVHPLQRLMASCDTQIKNIMGGSVRL